MKQQDNLEQLYRERYKNLETLPREELWLDIAARLPEKETKRKIFPLWFKIAGAAAVVVLLAVMGIGYFNSLEEPGTRVVYIENSRDNREYVVTSKEFEQNMLNSKEMLNSIRRSTLVLLQNKQQIYYPAETSPQDRKHSADLIANSEKLVAGLFKEERNRPEKFIVSLFPENQSAYNENDLKKYYAKAGKEELPEDTKAKLSNEKRFQLKTTAAAVVFDNLGKGSPIDNQLAGYDSGGDISFSYGIAVAYIISEKLSVRSGINKVDLSYNTKDVSYNSTLNAMEMGNSEASVLSLASPITGTINQSLGFVEVPVELKYEIFNKKVGLNLIGGASTFFLNQNNVILEAGNASTSFGEARNLNNVSFSTNIGLGVDYNISSQVQINLEPIFKYQINTFNNTSNVRPYYFGIYSGLSFRF